MSFPRTNEEKTNQQTIQATKQEKQKTFEGPGGPRWRSARFNVRRLGKRSTFFRWTATNQDGRLRALPDNCVRERPVWQIFKDALHDSVVFSLMFMTRHGIPIWTRPCKVACRRRFLRRCVGNGESSGDGPGGNRDRRRRVRRRWPRSGVATPSFSRRSRSAMNTLRAGLVFWVTLCLVAYPTAITSGIWLWDAKLIFFPNLLFRWKRNECYVQVSIIQFLFKNLELLKSSFLHLMIDFSHFFYFVENVTNVVILLFYQVSIIQFLFTSIKLLKSSFLHLVMENQALVI